MPLGIYKKMLWIFLAIIVFLVVSSLAAFLQAIFPPKIHSNITPDNLGMDFEEVEFESKDGIELKGWFIPHKNYPAQDIHEKGTLILLHGYPADKGNILPALYTLQEDFNLFLFDFRGLGESGGRYSTVGAFEVLDLKGAMEFLMEERGINEFGIWGFSMGGAVALMALGEHNEIKTVVSDSAYSNMADMAEELFRIPFIKKLLARIVSIYPKILWNVDIREVSPADSIRDSDIPILVIHSPSDEVIPFFHGERLREALINNKKAEFWFEEGRRHGEMGDSYKERVREFFLENL